MHNRDTAETALSLMPEIARACGLKEDDIQALYEELAHYDDTKIILHLLGMLSFTEHGYLTTPQLQIDFPELGKKIKLAQLSLDALIKIHLLHQTKDISASLERIESKIDGLTVKVNALQTNETQKKQRWPHRKRGSNTSKAGLFGKKGRQTKDSKEKAGYANLRKTQFIPN